MWGHGVGGSWVGGITADEVRDAWDGRLRPVEGELIPSGVEPGTRRFLTEVGLPTARVLAVQFAHDEGLSEPVWQGGRQFFVVTAERSSIPLAIETGSGEVFAFHADSPRYTKMFNSHIASLILHLGLLQRDALGLTGVSGDALEAALDRIRNSLIARDPAAMEGTASWTALLDDLESQIE